VGLMLNFLAACAMLHSAILCFFPCLACPGGTTLSGIRATKYLSESYMHITAEAHSWCLDTKCFGCHLISVMSPPPSYGARWKTAY
jgi:hypothetical protein